jgi:hypothetical protein
LGAAYFVSSFATLEFGGAGCFVDVALIEEPLAGVGFLLEISIAAICRVTDPTEVIIVSGSE